MNYRMIFSILGKVLCVEAAFMLPALVISLCCGERAAVFGFALTVLLLAALGVPLALLRVKRKEIFARDGLVTVGLVWLTVSLLGALPFFFSRAIPSYIDALFETASGFTTTGATILTEIASLPRGILYWRSFTHWLGGMGVLVFLLILSPFGQGSGGEAMHLLRAESPGVKIAKLVPRMRRSTGILYLIYVGLTVIMFLFLIAGKMPVFDSVCMALGVAGTGGFSVLNDSAAAYSPYCQWVITAFMLLFGVNFNIYFLLLLREAKRALRNEELRIYGAIVVAATAVITVNLLGTFATIGETVRHAAFQVAAVMSTTGLTTVDFNKWPELSKTILVLLMFCGACAGSTAGGLKVVRVAMIFKSVRSSIHKVLHPNAVCLMRMDGEVLDEETARSVNSYLIVYWLVLLGTLLLVSLDGMDFATNFTASLTCLNNVGPGLNVVSPAGSFAPYSGFSKLVFTFAMLTGRLELYPMLALLCPSAWKKISK